MEVFHLITHFRVHRFTPWDSEILRAWPGMIEMCYMPRIMEKQPMMKLISYSRAETMAGLWFQVMVKCRDMILLGLSYKAGMTHGRLRELPL
ncbi:hypothetical protein SDC9_187408 [bioreactor metagenome]|uniref:Uncharacterized protein n=1 Tax=bioreactor metagenome TaxID=1076179 RepID=A0A645HUN8_9ZZZZ